MLYSATHRPAVRAAAAIILLTALGSPLRAQDAPGADSVVVEAAATPAWPVILGRDTLFHITQPIGPFTAAQRADAVRQRLVSLARNPLARLDTVSVVEIEGRSDIMIGEIVLTTVTERDVAGSALSRQDLASARARAIAQALDRTAISRNIRSILLGIIYTLLATAALVFAIRLLNHVFTRVHRLVRMWQGSRIRSVRIQKLEVISAERIASIGTGIVTLLRIVVTLLIGYVYLLLVFSFFPWTRGVASRLVSYATDPVVSVIYGFIAYLPNLFYIIVILITTYYMLKVVHLIFQGLASGAISFSGFYPDWADPTYKIVRVLFIAMALILIWPHLPSSDRPEFKGVAAFLGLLLSLGAASAVSNVIGGVVMVYMRPFQIGDRVRIADTVGDVVQKTLLVTRVRTIKNVDITIPNSMVLGSHIINYSSTAQEDGGLVLHTTVTIGYDVPWRTVHETMLAAARATAHIIAEPAPFVLQTALNDYHVSYELNAYTDQPSSMARTYSELHQNIQDHCRDAGFEILSPAYEAHRDGSPSTIPPA